MIKTEEMSLAELSSCVDAPDWTVRAKCAERIARSYCGNALDAAARRAAEEALRRLSVDTEMLVRRLLAEALKAEATLPRDIALALAGDKPEVACPFLAVSPALDDSDLIAIVRENPGHHRRSIARRRNLSAAVSGALCRSEEPGIAAAVLANETARISATTLGRLLETQLDPELAKAVARRRLRSPDIGGIRHPRRPTVESAPWGALAR